jgi:hypothetical protein
MPDTFASGAVGSFIRGTLTRPGPYEAGGR